MTVEGELLQKNKTMDVRLIPEGIKNAGINSPIQIMELLCIPIRWCLPQQEILEV
jgi:hypothetical protein